MNQEWNFLKDKVANLIFSDEDCRDYLITIVSKALDIDKNIIKNNLELVSARINSNVNTKYNYADNIFQNNTSYISLEVNFNKSESTEIKNIRYICHMILKQSKPGESYKLKPIYQININNYDVFGANKFIYESNLMEKTLHQKRSNFMSIIDINVDILRRLDYNKLIKEEENSLKRLLYIFVCKDHEKLDKLYSNNKIMDSVRNKLDFITKNFDELLYYNHDDYMEQVSQELSLKQGIKQGILETAKRMLKENISIDIIMKVTDLTKDEIESLK